MLVAKAACFSNQHARIFMLCYASYARTVLQHTMLGSFCPKQLKLYQMKVITVSDAES